MNTANEINLGMPQAKPGAASASLAHVDIIRIVTPRTGRLVRVGTLHGGTALVLIACHGYGMDVERFAARFEGLPAEVCVLCPEGLSRFYWGGFSGRPVASWMTRAERLSEIDDFCIWMDQVYALATETAPGARVAALGFSQGAATVMRWADRVRPDLVGVVLWAGTPPEDIAYSPRAYWDGLAKVVYWGDGDELVRWAAAEGRFEEVGLSFEVRKFAGAHEVVAGVVRVLVGEMLERW